MNNTCITCRYFFQLTGGPVCINLRAPYLYLPGMTTDPAVTTCPQWATASRTDAEVLKPIHNQMDYDQMGR